MKRVQTYFPKVHLPHWGIIKGSSVRKNEKRLLHKSWKYCSKFFLVRGVGFTCRLRNVYIHGLIHFEFRAARSEHRELMHEAQFSVTRRWPSTLSAATRISHLLSAA